MSNTSIERDSLGDRMKSYENCSRHMLTRRSNVIVRVDGRAFHTYTRGCQKPFDAGLIRAMRIAAQLLAEDMQGFKFGYVQSDEASFLLTDYDNLHTSAWFDNNLSKLVSISASIMTAQFNRTAFSKRSLDIPATFDARAFVVPGEDAANYFLWRARDWSRNSLQMYARTFFSDSQLHGANRVKIHEMLHSIGKNWTTDLQKCEQNGSWLTWVPASPLLSLNDVEADDRASASLLWRDDILPNYESVEGGLAASFEARMPSPAKQP